MEDITQSGILLEYYQNNPSRDIPHKEIVPWAMEEYKKRTGKVFADPDRGIRHMSQNGLLIKVSKGVYRYEPDFIKHRNLEDFTPAQKEEIFKRDGYKCVQCGNGPWNGFEIHADHIKAKDKGGEATIINGQTLCGPHNYQKKNFNQTESGKKMFIRLYELAKKDNNQELLKFTTEVLDVFEKNGINGHIEWKK